MERHGIHELSGAYALHALDPEEERTFEEHLAHCDECRGHVAGFQEVGALLAHDVEAPPPPPALRQRILDGARAERPNVVPLRERRRWVVPVAAAAAVAASFAAVGLGIWAASLSSRLDDERAALDGSEQAVSVLAREDADRIPLSGANGTLVVDSSGSAWLVVFGLDAAPSDKTYEAWIVHDEGTTPAGLFRGGGSHTVVKLVRKVPPGSSVAVTLERAGGVEQPRNDPVFATARSA